MESWAWQTVAPWALRYHQHCSGWTIKHLIDSDCRYEILIKSHSIKFHPIKCHHNVTKTYSGWWLYTHPSEKYEFVNWDDYSILFPRLMRQSKIDGNQTTNQHIPFISPVHPANSHLSEQLVPRGPSPQGRVLGWRPKGKLSGHWVLELNGMISLMNFSGF